MSTTLDLTSVISIVPLIVVLAVLKMITKMFEEFST